MRERPLWNSDTSLMDFNYIGDTDGRFLSSLRGFEGDISSKLPVPMFHSEMRFEYPTASFPETSNNVGARFTRPALCSPEVSLIIKFVYLTLTFAR